MANELVPFYEPGDAITGCPTTAVIGMRAVTVSGARQTAAGPNKGLISIAPAAAQARIFGLAGRDAAIGVPVKVFRKRGMVVPWQATAVAITANTEVEVGANAMCQAKNTGVAVGYVVDDCAANGLAQVSLY